MNIVLAALFAFAILTLWVPAYWPVAVFQIGVFAFTAVALLRARKFPPFFYPLLPLSFAVLAGLLQWLAGSTISAFDARVAVLRWSAFLSVFLIASTLFRDKAVARSFRSFMLWFGFSVAVVATLQTFTSHGKIFWLFPTGYTDFLMGPILSRNHYAAFIEVVLPLALYKALRRPADALLYGFVSAVLFASVIASASRAGTVLCAAEILAVPALMLARRRAAPRDVAFSVLRMALLFALFLAVVGWQTVWTRFWQADPMAARRELDVASLHMIAAHPWTGVGLGAWSVVYPRYAIADFGLYANQAHSDWLQWTAEGGLPLGLAMLSLFLWSLRPALRSIWGLGVIAVFLHATVDYPFSRPALGSWTILLIALSASSALPPRPLRLRGEKLLNPNLNHPNS